MTSNVDVLVIGAGLAGLAAARDLTRAGFSVLLLEKSRGVGGRATTKRLAVNLEDKVLESIVRADHGAQFFTARSERFKGMVAQLSGLGIVHEWTRGFPRLGPSGLEQRSSGNPRFVCSSGMSALGKSIQAGSGQDPALNIEFAALVSAVSRSGQGWTAVLENGGLRHGKSLAVNLPAPQALTLLNDSISPASIKALNRVRFDPCWAVVVALETRPEPGWVAVEIDHPSLAWASLDHTKRTTDSPPVLVLHATPAWSLEHLESPPEMVLETLLRAAQELLGGWVGNHLAAVAHRWRYALPTARIGQAFLAEENLVCCGDWCSPTADTAMGRGSPRIESALESGWASAAYLSEHLSNAIRSTS